MIGASALPYHHSPRSSCNLARSEEPFFLMAHCLCPDFGAEVPRQSSHRKKESSLFFFILHTFHCRSSQNLHVAHSCSETHISYWRRNSEADTTEFSFVTKMTTEIAASMLWRSLHASHPTQELESSSFLYYLQYSMISCVVVTCQCEAVEFDSCSCT
jgi:hypothetical protein